MCASVAEPIDLTKEALAKQPIINKSKYRVTVEPLGFIYLTAGIIQSIVTPNLYLYKVCAVNFNINETLCDPRKKFIRNQTELSDRIQKYVSTLNIYGSLIDHVPAIFLMLFLLKWSDTHGRKPLMIAPIVGHVICTLVDILNYYVKSWSAEYLLLATVPLGLTGGRGVFFLVISRYLIDITTEETRTWRMGLNAGIMGIAVPIANLISGYIYASGGYLAIWITALGLYACAFLYVLFGFKDTRGKKALNDYVIYEKKLIDKENIESTQTCGVLKRICMDILKNLWSSFYETLKERQGYKRARIWILMIIICFLFFSNANNGVGYLFSRKVFGWDAPDWAFYVTLVSSSSVIGTLIILPTLSGYFKVRDGIIVSIGLLSNITTNLVATFAVSPLMFQLSAIGFLLGVSTTIVTRSIFSKMLDTNEISPVFSVLACLESLVPLFSSPTFNLIYQATIGFFPGCFFLVRVVGNFIALCLFGVLFAVKKKESNMVQTGPFPTDKQVD